MMKKLMPAAILTLLLCAITASAQTVTGPTLLQRISIDLGRQHDYRIDLKKDKIYLVNGATGSTMVMEQSGRQMVTIKGAVADLSRLPAESRKRAMARIALFNFSSPVGTMMVDEKTGQVTMVHYVNPRMASTATIAQVAELCGDVIRQQAATLAQ